MAPLLPGAVLKVDEMPPLPRAFTEISDGEAWYIGAWVIWVKPTFWFALPEKSGFSGIAGDVLAAKQ